MNLSENVSKFESLYLDRAWIETAEHVDIQLSNPEYVL